MRKIEIDRLIENVKSNEIFGFDVDDDNRLLLSVSIIALSFGCHAGLSKG